MFLSTTENLGEQDLSHPAPASMKICSASLGTRVAVHRDKAQGAGPARSGSDSPAKGQAACRYRALNQYAVRTRVRPETANFCQ